MTPTIRTTNVQEDHQSVHDDNEKSNGRHIGDAKDVESLYAAICEYAETHAHVRQSLHTLECAVRIFGRDNISVAFNGGKDATVVFYLTLAAYFGCNKLTNTMRSKVHCLYLDSKGNNFEELDEFVRRIVATSDDVVECLTVQLGIRQGIEKFLQQRHEEVEVQDGQQQQQRKQNQKQACAFVMGTRRTDPHGTNMERFEPSSHDWPPFMRVNPILDWSYHDVWEFVRALDLPFCSLYERGYTSLGSVESTRPNPALRRVGSKGDADDDDDDVCYEPAWMLEDATLERAGRILHDVAKKPK